MCYKVLVKLIYETKIETHIQCQVHWVALNKCPFSPVNVFIARCDFFVSLGELLAQRHSSSKLLQNLFFVPLFDTSHILSYCAMAPHSSTVAWKIPWMEEPGRLQSMESLRVGHDWATSLSLSTFMHWRRKWQPTPVLLPGESQGRGSLVGCRLWGRTESDTTEAA